MHTHTLCPFVVTCLTLCVCEGAPIQHRPNAVGADFAACHGVVAHVRPYQDPSAVIVTDVDAGEHERALRAIDSVTG
jgi:hypothetical protein